MKIVEILQESLNTDSAIQTLKVSLDALSQNLKTSIASLQDALEWNDPGQTLPAIRPVINWLNDNYYSGRGKSGYNIESALSTLKHDPKYRKLAKFATDNIVTMATRENKVSTITQIYGLVTAICQILQQSNSARNIDSCNHVTKSLNEFIRLYKELKSIPMKDRGVEPNSRYTATNVAPMNQPKVVKSSQNAQVDKIINDVLSTLDKQTAHEIRNAISKSDNKLQALQHEMKKRKLH